MGMATESARNTSAAEARFRIEAPNSLPRVVKVIALDAESEALAKGLSRLPWQHAEFLIAPHSASGLEAAATNSIGHCLTDLAGRTTSLGQKIGAADLVVLLAASVGNAPAAQMISETCRIKGVMTTALIVAEVSTSEEALSRMLAQLRPCAPTLVIASGEDFLADMLTALRA
jgi:hypothetical protein